MKSKLTERGLQKLTLGGIALLAGLIFYLFIADAQFIGWSSVPQSQVATSSQWTSPAVLVISSGGLVLFGLFVILLLMLVYRRWVRPSQLMLESIYSVVTCAREGRFDVRARSDCPGRVGEIAVQLNGLMDQLHLGVDAINKDVVQLTNFHAEGQTNKLTMAVEVVESLVEVSQFKQQIEEDLTKVEVYRRIGNIIQNKFGLERYTIYEVSSSQNRMHPVLVNGEQEGMCRWCRQEVQFRAELCRAQRTGRIVDGVEQPNICNQFYNDSDHPLGFYCMPVLHSGTVGNVVQLVVEPDMAVMFPYIIPFLQVFLRESSSVIESKRLMEKLRESALKDPLTGLNNRRFLEEYERTIVASSQRKEMFLSVLMMDLDHFKMVNDTHGHQVGDAVLKSLAGVLMQQTRASDLVVRYGGEEFMVVLQNERPHMGNQIAEKIRETVERLKINVPGGCLQKTISIGVAEFPTDGTDFDDVVEKADMALYRAKEQGRNRVISHSASETEDKEEQPAVHLLFKG
ncbi:diguanylate cyclase [Magnetococcus marinus MC-1]|uniref:diguanylate cyclase n=1 Tax=Magnetococcus marinus (strain ATCC BAA-1437 / JCM 17883 / MC-1) TaxID=156889 RepID=A0LD73_MAGMM|nr:diguanylate cyclase [Magnetococcus marinus]ABK45916.1 diguanylate cyclase [Magnetococcus marinus MC-1]